MMQPAMYRDESVVNPTRCVGREPITRVAVVSSVRRVPASLHLSFFLCLSASPSPRRRALLKPRETNPLLYIQTSRACACMYALARILN